MKNKIAKQENVHKNKSQNLNERKLWQFHPSRIFGSLLKLSSNINIHSFCFRFSQIIRPTHNNIINRRITNNNTTEKPRLWIHLIQRKFMCALNSHFHLKTSSMCNRKLIKKCFCVLLPHFHTIGARCRRESLESSNSHPGWKED